MKVFKNYHYILSFILFATLLYVAIAFEKSDRLTLIALFATALIYSFQLGVMNQQERILEEQKDIAKKQYDFDIFQMRMNLRNELHETFTFSLSAIGQDIADDVNIKLVDIGRVLNDIKFAFPASIPLTTYIEAFKSCCDKITRLAKDKEIIIECSEKKSSGKGHVIQYKDCLQVYSENGNNHGEALYNKQIFDTLNISQKEKVIIFAIMRQYIDCGASKWEIENHLIKLFRAEMQRSNEYLKLISDLLDKDICLQ